MWVITKAFFVSASGDVGELSPHLVFDLTQFLLNAVVDSFLLELAHSHAMERCTLNCAGHTPVMTKGIGDRASFDRACATLGCENTLIAFSTSAS